MLFRAARSAPLFLLLSAAAFAEIRALPTAHRQREPEIDAASDEAKNALTRMQLPAGLQASLWAAEPLLANPVAFNFDEQGRIFVAETYRYRSSVLDIRDIMWMLEDELANRNQDDFLATLRRHYGEKGLNELSQESEVVRLLEDTNGDGVADKSSVYADNFRTPIDGIASGVLARRGEVWFTNIPALWKFTGRDRAETREAVFKGFGVRFNYTGHDFHGLILGPDGRLYFSIGDRGTSVTTKEGRHLDVADTGAVFRCWPDGSGLEVFATGLRNPQSLLFNEYGDLFTGDNDSDQGDEERLVHVVEGSDSGWRIGYQFAPRGHAGPWNEEKLWRPRHATQPAYITPPLANIEDGPSGIAYYPGTGLNASYVGDIFITHFKGSPGNSGIFTYRLKPAGASYTVGEAAPFLTGALPTDVRFGPDGRLYYSDWADGWPKSKRGRIYAIADPASANAPLVKETQALIASDWTKKSSAELAALLGHADWRVRLEAQYTLAERGAPSVAVLTDVLAKSTAPLARRHAVWALGQLSRQVPAALDPLPALLADADAEIRAQAAKLLGDGQRQDAAPPLIAALQDAGSRVKFFAAQSLGKLRAPAAVPALLAAARANADADAFLRHALVLGLAGCAMPAQLAATATDEARPVRLAALLALRRQASAEIAVFLQDKDPLLVREAALAINDQPIPGAFPALAALLTKPGKDQPTLLRALNAGFRLGTTEQAAALAAIALSAERAPVLRAEAVTLLSEWAQPPARDRNVGIFRPVSATGRTPDAGRLALADHLPGLLAADSPESVQAAAIKAAVELKLAAAGPALQSVVADPARPVELRIAALKALDQLGVPQLVAALTAAVASDVASLRLAALPISTRLDPSSAPAVLSRLAIGTAAERRAAYAALGALPGAEADRILADSLRDLAAGHVPPGAQLELLEAAALRSDPTVKQLLAAHDAAVAADPDPLAPYRTALAGGSSSAGRKLAREHPVMQCIRCHHVDGNGGGDAGPVLIGIGARQSREYLLEALIKPSARIAAGFQLVTVTKTDGSVISGTVLEDTPAALRLRVDEHQEITISKAEIRATESAPSAMPELAGLVLTKGEIRDLIEFLASLKTQPIPRDKQPIRALRPAEEAGKDTGEESEAGHGQD